MMYDLKHFLPKAEIKGIDISRYCKKNAQKNVKKDIKVGSCDKLPFKNNYFDFIISISTIHNLSEKKIPKALKELIRLEVLTLNNNKISDVSALKGLNRLDTLWLHNNEISDVSPLKELKNCRIYACKTMRIWQKLK